MRISKKKFTAELEKESLQELFGAIGNIRTIRDMDLFLNTFFTTDEKQAILRRSAIVRLLQNGKKYKEINDLLDVSKNTISNARDMIEGRGYGRNPNRQRVYSNLAPKTKERRKPILTRKYKGASSIF